MPGWANDAANRPRLTSDALPAQTGAARRHRLCFALLVVAAYLAFPSEPFDYPP